MSDISTNAIAILQQYIDSGVTFVVDFYAHWCGPCKILGPQLKALCADLKIPLLMINGDHSDSGAAMKVEEIMKAYSINAFPTVLIFKKGTKKPVKIVGVNLKEIKANL